MNELKSTWQSAVLTRITEWIATSAGTPPTAKELYLRAIDVAFREYGELPLGTDLRDALQAAKNSLPASATLPLGSGNVPAQAIDEYVRALSAQMARHINDKSLSPAAIDKANALIGALHATLHADLAKQFAADVQAMQGAHAAVIAQTKETADQAVATAQTAAQEIERAYEVAVATVTELRESLIDYAQRMSKLEHTRDEALARVAKLEATLAAKNDKIDELLARTTSLQETLVSVRASENDAKKAHLLALDGHRQAETKLATASAKLTQAGDDLSKARFDLVSLEKNHLTVLKELTERHDNELKRMANTAETARAGHEREVALLSAARTADTQRAQEQAQLIAELRATLASHQQNVRVNSVLAGLKHPNPKD